MTEAVRKKLATKQVVPRILWFALTLSVAIYVVVIHAVVQGAPIEVDPILRLVLIVMAVSTGVGSLAAPIVLLSDSALSRRLAAAQPTPRAQAEGLTEIESRRFVAVDGLTVPFIFRFALGESVCVFGLVLAVLGENAAAIYPFAAVSMVLMVLAFPNVASIYARLERLG